ncbi:SDR family oxidoreductase [Chryseolinea lacunae]|uniref:SDR family NAD(P)-dependent oxidoreductase n=1 Tax=Chryseolinea lacunae TaxID=2801331 RepID=A0ABS1L0Y3_9BACT|nr:SDR family NAD(P)-dependent oxidoreductase [Chryseolinea lacunae]MBL0745346.1 SDR family NAD(P)-dependent oxidoreductase [Chryseolinea lacunae]
MKTTQNTVLITGGSAGIGFEIAKQFAAKGNAVIITGRDQDRLNRAAAQIPGVTAIPFDVTKGDNVDQLAKTLAAKFPNLNVVVNNAGRAFVHSLSDDYGTFEKASEEMLTNYLSVIRLNEALLPLLKKQDEAAIVNVTSIVAFAPNHKLSTYGASKAALHSYSQSLRLALAKSSNIKVFELMPPLVNTEFSTEIGGERGIPPSEVASDLVSAFEEDRYEVHVGATAHIYTLTRTAPEEALLTMNP